MMNRDDPVISLGVSPPTSNPFNPMQKRKDAQRDGMAITISSITEPLN